MVATRLDAKTIFARMDACESLLNRNKIDSFLKRWLAMKNGSLTTTWSANGRGRKAVRLPRRWRPGRFFCVFGGIGRESSTMSCFLWANAKFGSVLPTTGPLECSTHAEEAIFDQQRPNCPPSGQRQATHIFGDAPEASGARMGGYFASTV